jgi:hypothetical protein
MTQSRTKALTGIGFVMILAVALTTHAAIITNGLVGRWIFNEGYGITVNDSSGQGNNGTLSGAAGFITNDSVKQSVLSVYGTSGVVTYPYTTTLQPFAGTICVWVKPAAAQLADIVRLDTNLLIRTNMAGNYYAYDLRVTSTGQLVGILANDDPKTGPKQPQITASTSANAVPLGQWTHVAMEWDGTSAFYVFVNGKLSGKTTYHPNPTDGLSYHGQYPLEVATANYDYTNGHLDYTGELSDLRVYSRALTSKEIAGIANGGE